MGYNIQIDNEYVAVLLIEILFEKGLVNRQTYINAKKTAKFAHFTNSLFIGTI